MPFILVNNLNIYFRLRRSQRAKRLQVQFHYEGFEVVAPMRFKNRDVISFIWENRQWMAQIQNKKNNQDTQNKIIIFNKENKLFYRGKYLGVSFFKGEDFKINWLDESNIVCFLSINHVHQPHVYFIEWLREQTKEMIESVVKTVCPKLDKWPQKIVLKDQKTRWGSCGINHSIQINWRLIFAPVGVLEYVVVHELCHLLHKNHGVRFWNKVEKFFPEYKLARIWLRKHGDQLMKIDLDVTFWPQESFRSLIESL